MNMQYGQPPGGQWPQQPQPQQGWGGPPQGAPPAQQGWGGGGAVPPGSPFAGMGQLKSTGFGNYIEEGFGGILVLDKMTGQTSQQSGQFQVVTEWRILETNMPEVHPVGGSVSYVMDWKHQAAKGNYQSILAALEGIDPSDAATIARQITPEFAIAASNGEQRLRGRVVGVQASVGKMTKGRGPGGVHPITLLAWKPIDRNRYAEAAARILSSPVVAGRPKMAAPPAPMHGGGAPGGYAPPSPMQGPPAGFQMPSGYGAPPAAPPPQMPFQAAPQGYAAPQAAPTGYAPPPVAAPPSLPFAPSQPTGYAPPPAAAAPPQLPFQPAPQAAPPPAERWIVHPQDASQEYLEGANPPRFRPRQG